MKIKERLQVNKERGSATIEAIISFTGFLFVIFTILNVVNICRAQMLISNAVDTATKELTQYSYFYEMSGLSKFKDDADAQAKIGADNLNSIIGTVDEFATTVGGAYDNTVQHKTNIENAAREGELDMDVIQDGIRGIDNDIDKISNSITSMETAFGDVAENPLKYMKSLVAVAGSEFIDTTVSHVIAAPVSKALFTKHFGSNSREASEELERLGVVDGLNGMNFRMSTMFSKDEPDAVHIVVYYKLKLVQLFEWANLEVPMCKESIGLAWLGGDDVINKVEPMPPLDKTDEGGETTENGETTDENSSGSTDLWALPTRSEDGYYAVRSTAFDELLGETYGFEAYSNTFVKGNNGAIGYGCMNVSGAGADEGTFIAQNAYYSVATSLKDAKSTYDPKSPTTSYNYNPDNIKQIVFVVYVPENIPEDKLNTIKANSEKDADKYKKQAKDLLGRELDVNISFVKAGGNYDYGSENK